ncbi:MAG: ROK family transcriptional regulator [Propionibacteriaceae bacterium]|nr:ROK family transcriptional regulator [Propionibacteriaceae bacterium]
MSPLRNQAAPGATIVSLVASGRATTRAAIAQTLGWSPTTVSVYVQQLLDDGVLAQTQMLTGHRGRPTGLLCLAGNSGRIVAVDLGGRHASLAVMSLAGVIEHRADLPINLAERPEVVLELIAKKAEELVAKSAPNALRALGLAVPGPVNFDQGIVTMPARMPGWAGFAVRDWLANRLGVPVFVENDANLMAYAEHVVRHSRVRGEEANLTSTVTVKAGTGIGAGIIVGGTIYRGATYAAGDITHYRVAAAGDTPCSCGNRGCLETIASGAALVASLQAQGLAVATTGDVVALARGSDPAATTALRAAGANLGRVMCAVVNFFNPSAVYVGGLMATVEPFVAAVRAELYKGSHPLVTSNLLVEPTRAKADGVLIGCGRLTIEESLELENRQ